MPPQDWSYDEKASNNSTCYKRRFQRIYITDFLAYLIWGPGAHTYNAVTNGWKNFEHQITFDVRQPKTHRFTMQRLRKFIAEHPYVNVIRYHVLPTSSLVFRRLQRKYVDWYGYSAACPRISSSSSRREAGYKFRPRFIIDGLLQQPVPHYALPGNSRISRPSSGARWQKLAKEMVDITHELGKEAMMFLGDHWISFQALYVDEFKDHHRPLTPW